MREPRPYAPLTSRYGTIGQNGEWQEAIEAYYWDRLPEAFAVAQSLGAGFAGSGLRWYRMIEGEALTRERAEIQELDANLSLEHDPNDIELGDEHLQAIQTAVRTAAKRLGWDFSMAVRTTILLDEVDAPWHGARYGYCVDKYPFDKVCIPARAATNPGMLYAVMAHEFTHVITLNLTQGRIPHWLDEGLAMLMENTPSRPTAEWLNPVPLNAAFEADRRDSQGMARSSAAYVQSAQLVRYLHSLQGDAGLAKLVRAFTNNNLWDEIKINVFGEPSVEEALHEVYGVGQRELFEAAQ